MAHPHPEIPKVPPPPGDLIQPETIMVYAVLHNNVNQRSENVLHIFSHFHFMFNCLKQWIQKTVLGMVIADKKKINTPG